MKNIYSYLLTEIVDEPLIKFFDWPQYYFFKYIFTNIYLSNKPLEVFHFILTFEHFHKFMELFHSFQEVFFVP